MPVQDSSTAPEHPHTEIDFAQGINLANLEQVSGAQLEQLIREATTSPNRALITVQDTAPDVVNNPRLKRYPWIKTLDADKSKWVMRFYQGPATDESGWIIGSPQFAAGSLPLAAISTQGGVIGYFLGLNPQGQLAYLAIPQQSTSTPASIPASGISPGTAWQFLLTGPSLVAQWRSFLDFATANAGICPITFLAPGPGSTYLSTNNVGDLVWVPPIVTSASQLLPPGGANGNTLGIANNIRQWVDGWYIAGILPELSVPLNVLKPITGTPAPAIGDIVCWNGTKFISCPGFHLAEAAAFPATGLKIISVLHHYATPPMFFSARLRCTAAGGDAGYAQNHIVSAHNFSVGPNHIPIWADNASIYLIFGDDSLSNPDVINPIGDHQNADPAKWVAQFFWI